jgi:hypothetical protein
LLLSSPVQAPVIVAAALAASVAVPGVGRAGPDRGALPAAPAGAASEADPSLLGFSRRPGSSGLCLRRPLTSQSALAVDLSSGTARELPEVRVILGLQYSF